MYVQIKSTNKQLAENLKNLNKDSHPYMEGITKIPKYWIYYKNYNPQNIRGGVLV